MSSFLVRIRHSQGTTRIELPNKSSTTIKQLKELIFNKLSSKPKPSTQQLTINGKTSDIPLTNNLTLESLNINHGHMFYLKIVSSAIVCKSNNNNTNTNKRPSRKRKLNQINSSNNNTNQPPKKRTRLNNNNSNIKKKKKSKNNKKKSDEFLIIKSEGNTMDEIINNYFSESNELQLQLKLLPIEKQKLYSNESRIENILNNSIKITEYLEQSRFTSKAKSRGKRYLIIEYKNKRKKVKEMICFYNDDKINEIIKNIILKSIDKNELNNKINDENINKLIKKSKLTLNEISDRSPPLLWSLFHSFPNKKLNNVIGSFVRNIWKALRNEIKHEMKEK